ncbi:hypothetical protein [Herbiconiux daphne]|uniref:Uncharacterized protein n=1 Tax=Herbiconiux daphne TaxID=2970914 RepID=A0ABT2GX10_9MICO|nr:hypothetical protein [Herbiconiux daphne]MCS5732484.1 hypothetical protein [Herbiconiux daphne]
MDTAAKKTLRRAELVVASIALAAGLAAGLTACNPGAQTGPYRDSPAPTLSPTPTQSIFPTPVPTTVDDSGTLHG